VIIFFVRESLSGKLEENHLGNTWIKRKVTIEYGNGLANFSWAVNKKARELYCAWF